MLRTICHRDFIFPMLPGLGANMTCTDFGFTKQKGQGHKGSFLNKWFPLIFLITSYHRAMIFYMLIGLGKDMTPILHSQG